MVSLRELKHAEKLALQQQHVVLELNSMVKDIERCERTIVDLKLELESVNTRHQGPRTTRQDVDYLSALLECAKKKLAWEKQIGSIQKRMPALLETMSELMNDPKAPPSDETRSQLLASLKRVQEAMERLQSVKAD